jgi:nitroimidazol reductase NimA-like FMN-containing flavoprotein (pyridoxamine 5'-phosphate oxidase superfamily)
VTTGMGPAGSGDVAGARPGEVWPACGPAARQRTLGPLSPGECLDLLESGGVGRVGFASADGIMMLPVNFAVAGKAIFFRTAPDTLLALHANGPLSFQVDRLDEKLHEGWSVLVHGHARQVAEEREIKRIESQTHLEPWAAGPRDVYVRIAPVRISGRRLGSA